MEMFDFKDIVKGMVIDGDHKARLISAINHDVFIRVTFDVDGTEKYLDRYFEKEISFQGGTKVINEVTGFAASMMNATNSKSFTCWLKTPVSVTIKKGFIQEIKPLKQETTTQREVVVKRV